MPFTFTKACDVLREVLVNHARLGVPLLEDLNIGQLQQAFIADSDRWQLAAQTQVEIAAAYASRLNRATGFSDADLKAADDMLTTALRGIFAVFIHRGAFRNELLDQLDELTDYAETITLRAMSTMMQRHCVTTAMLDRMARMELERQDIDARREELCTPEDGWHALTCLREAALRSGFDEDAQLNMVSWTDYPLADRALRFALVTESFEDGQRGRHFVVDTAEVDIDELDDHRRFTVSYTSDDRDLVERWCKAFTDAKLAEPCTSLEELGWTTPEEPPTAETVVFKLAAEDAEVRSHYQHDVQCALPQGITGHETALAVTRHLQRSPVDRAILSAERTSPLGDAMNNLAEQAQALLTVEMSRCRDARSVEELEHIMEEAVTLAFGRHELIAPPDWRVQMRLLAQPHWHARWSYAAIARHGREQVDAALHKVFISQRAA